MSYVHKSRVLSGFGSTATVNTRTGDDGVRIIQTQLQRIGFLGPGTGPGGVDGKWGPRTENAMQNAARYVNYTGTPFTRAGTTVTIPDDLMSLIQNAPPATPGTPGAVTGGGGTTTGSDTTGLMTPTTPGDAAAATGGGFPWMPVLLVTGGVVALAAVAYAARRKYPTTIGVRVGGTPPVMRRHRSYSRHAARHAARHSHRRQPKETIRIY